MIILRVPFPVSRLSFWPLLSFYTYQLPLTSHTHPSSYTFSEHLVLHDAAALLVQINHIILITYLSNKQTATVLAICIYK